MRYVGQAHELTIDVPKDAFSRREAAPLRSAFETEYLRRYGLTLDGMPVEIVSWRVSVQGPPILALARSAAAGPKMASVQSGTRRAYFRECGGSPTPSARREPGSGRGPRSRVPRSYKMTTRRSSSRPLGSVG